MHVVELAISLIAPHTCVNCGSSEAVLCDECLVGLKDPEISRCVYCNTLTQDNKTCGSCRRTHPLQHIWSTSNYLKAETAIQAYKFGRVRELYKPIASEMAIIIPYSDYDYIVAVPTAPRRIRVRGYDQAELLAKQIAELTNTKALQPLFHSGSKRQLGSRRDARFMQAHQSYQLKRGVDLTNRRILLVDDVVTTGATLSACAQRLKSAGARSVDGLVFARRSRK